VTIRVPQATDSVGVVHHILHHNGESHLQLSAKRVPLSRDPLRTASWRCVRPPTRSWR
jgi:hypothetical protein